MELSGRERRKKLIQEIDINSGPYESAKHKAAIDLINRIKLDTKTYTDILKILRELPFHHSKKSEREIIDHALDLIEREMKGNLHSVSAFEQEKLFDYIKELEIRLKGAGEGLPAMREDVQDLLDNYKEE